MADKLSISFVLDWDNDLLQLATLQDGLWAAVVELKKRGHSVEMFTLCEALKGSITRDGLVIRTFTQLDELKALITQLNASNTGRPVILHWGDTTRPNARVGRDMGIPQAICFAGGIPFGPTSNEFDHFFVESEDYYQSYLNSNFPVSRAFGTNTTLYDPDHPFVKGQSKQFDICFPATYAAWKRHTLLEELAVSFRTVCSGYMYDSHETECWQVVQRSGALVLPHIPANGLRHLLAASRVCVIPSANNGGSQRTVLEAMAMGIPVIVMDDSAKTSEYVQDAINQGFKVGAIVPPDPLAIRRAINEWLDAKTNGREYILSKWSHTHYAEALESGLDKLVGSWKPRG